MCYSLTWVLGRPTNEVCVEAPINDIVKKFIERKFLKVENCEFTPQIIKKVTSLPAKDIIIWFRSILFGYLNFHSFADNKQSFNRIYWYLKRSLTRTLCYKENIGWNRFKRKYGTNVTLSILRKDGKTVYLDFKCPSLRPTPTHFMTPYLSDPLQRIEWNISTISALGQPCANCGTDKNIEMHHLKHIKSINVKLDSMGKMMAKINRKQVPLCKECHNRVHNGSYTGFSLKHFHHIQWKGEAKWA